jgi:hypothetical protein
LRFFEAISRYSLYLLLFKEKSKRMPLLSGLGCGGIFGFQAKLEAVPIKNDTMNKRLHA